MINIDTLEQEFKDTIGSLQSGVEALKQIQSVRTQLDMLQSDQKKASALLRLLEQHAREGQNRITALLDDLENGRQTLQSSQDKLDTLLQQIPEQVKDITQEQVFQHFTKKIGQELQKFHKAVSSNFKILKDTQTKLASDLESTRHDFSEQLKRLDIIYNEHNRRTRNLAIVSLILIITLIGFGEFLRFMIS